MRAFVVFDVTDEITGSIGYGGGFPVAINAFSNCDSATGKFFVVLFLGWLMILELIALAFLYVFGFIFALALSCVPILNLCILKDAIDDDSTIDKIIAIFGIVVDVIILIIVLINKIF